MAVTRRYQPSHAPGEDCTYGMDFSYLLPPGVGVQQGQLTIYLNINPPAQAPVGDFSIGPVRSQGRTLYARLAGGVEGSDYQLRWQCVDTDGNIWPRTGLVLCATTS